MKGKWMLMGAAVVAAGIGWIVLNREAGIGKPLPRSSVPCAKSCGSERSEEEQAFLDAVLESPETLDGTVAELAVPTGQAGSLRHEASEPVCTLPVGRERHLLSDVEKPPAPQPLKEPVAAESLYFHADYASLRKDAIRNPNSPENRAGVVSLMQARQRRLGQTK